MSFDQYKPPETNVAPDKPETKQPVRGVLYPMVIDIVGTLAFQTIAAIIYALMLASRGFSETQISTTFENLPTFSLFNILTILIGMFFSTLAGFLCIRISRGISYLYPSILAAITFVLYGLLMAGETFNAESAGWGLLSFALTLFGAYLALRVSPDNSP